MTNENENNVTVAEPSETDKTKAAFQVKLQNYLANKMLTNGNFWFENRGITNHTFAIIPGHSFEPVVKFGVVYVGADWTPPESVK